MGLGKTLQAIGFIDIFLRYTASKHVLCVVPVNTLQNWLGEFDKWLPPPERVSASEQSTNQIVPRSFQVFILSEAAKNMDGRLKVFIKYRFSFWELSQARLVPSVMQDGVRACGGLVTR